jgi:hypothetical protein
MKTQFEIWLAKVDADRKKRHESGEYYSDYTPLKVKKGSKFMKIMDSNHVWAFVSMVDGYHMGVPVKKGDLMKPASWRAPAKHSRGNIFDGTAKWSHYGPTYL